MRTGYKVCDAMTETPVTVPPDMLVSQCAEIMRDSNVGGLLVKDKEKLLGICTEQDIVRRLIADKKDVHGTKVQDIMVTDMKQISPEKDIFEAIVMMRDFNIRHVPVIDSKKFVGLLTMKDVLKIEPQLFDLLVDKIELKEEERKPINISSGEDGVCQVCGKYCEKMENIDDVLMCEECRKDNS